MADGNELGLSHHRVCSCGVEADVASYVAAMGAEEPDEERGAMEVLEDAVAEVSLSDDDGGGQVELPALAVGGGVPVVDADAPPSEEEPLHERRHRQRDHRRQVLHDDESRNHPQPDVHQAVVLHLERAPPQELCRELEPRDDRERPEHGGKAPPEAAVERMDPCRIDDVGGVLEVEGVAKGADGAGAGSGVVSSFQQHRLPEPTPDPFGPSLVLRVLHRQPPGPEHHVPTYYAPGEEDAAISDVGSCLDADRGAVLSVCGHDDGSATKYHVVPHLQQVVLHQPLEQATRPVDTFTHFGPQHPQDPAHPAVVDSDEMPDLLQSFPGEQLPHQPVAERFELRRVPFARRELADDRLLDDDDSKEPEERQHHRPHNPNRQVVSNPLRRQEPEENIAVCVELSNIPRVQHHHSENKEHRKLLEDPNHPEDSAPVHSPQEVWLRKGYSATELVCNVPDDGRRDVVGRGVGTQTCLAGNRYSWYNGDFACNAHFLSNHDRGEDHATLVKTERSYAHIVDARV
mmetsp:Transcript_34220/g.77048  ORF Transcript_34220/g.77048 Transcript_34220/m.77048 type:complete len:517 (+) Transcript_34220:428-1978(+)